MCKMFSSEVAERVTSLAVNLFGGNGFVKDYPVEKLFRDAKIGQIYEGTSNLQLQTIAKQSDSGERLGGRSPPRTAALPTPVRAISANSGSVSSVCGPCSVHTA